MKPLGVCKRCGEFEGSCKCGKGKIIIDGKKREIVSKFLSGLLRHFPHSFGLKLDKDGWADLKDVAKIVNERYNVGKKVIELIVKFDPKGRFEIKNGKIRAKYGHSVDVNVDWSESCEIPDRLYHGTSPLNLKSIFEKGILPMKRKEVHLSATPEDAIEVGKRHHPNPVVLVIDAKALQNAGFKIRKKGKVYTTDYVPPDFIVDVLISE